MLKVFFFLVLFGLFIQSNKSQKVYLFFLMLLLFLAISLRNKVCFLDTFSYVNDYNSLSIIDYSSIKYFWLKDPSFWYLSKAISTLSNGNYTVWFAILAICYVTPLYFLLRDYSNNISISLILFCCLGFMLFSMTGLRQTLAMGCTMGALYSLLKSRRFLFAILVFLGTLFHKTAIVFILLYPLIKIPLSKRYLFIYVIFGMIAYVLSIKYLPILMVSEIDPRLADYLQSDSSLNYSGLIRQFMCFIISFLLLGKKREIPVNRIFLLMSLVGIFFQSMTGILPEMFRVSMYFSIANIFLLANALTCNKKYVLIKYIVVIALCLYYVTSNNAGFLMDYYFSFQEEVTTNTIV